MEVNEILELNRTNQIIFIASAILIVAITVFIVFKINTKDKEKMKKIEKIFCVVVPTIIVSTYLTICVIVNSTAKNQAIKLRDNIEKYTNAKIVEFNISNNKFEFTNDMIEFNNSNQNNNKNNTNNESDSSNSISENESTVFSETTNSNNEDDSINSNGNNSSYYNQSEDTHESNSSVNIDNDTNTDNNINSSSKSDDNTLNKSNNSSNESYIKDNNKDFINSSNKFLYGRDVLFLKMEDNVTKQNFIILVENDNSYINIYREKYENYFIKMYSEND